MANELSKIDIGALVQVLTQTAPAPMPTGIISGSYQAWKLSIQEEISLRRKNIAENNKAEAIAKTDTIITIVHSQAKSEMEGNRIQRENDRMANETRKEELEVQGGIIANQIQLEKLEQEKQETRSVTFQNDTQIRSMGEYLNGINPNPNRPQQSEYRVYSEPHTAPDGSGKVGNR